jgi:hypothetical protein
MRIKIFQIDIDKDKEKAKFRALNEIKEINPEIYKTVYYGDVEAQNLEDIYAMFNDNRPPTFQGHSLSMSDIVQICDKEDTLMENDACYYCDEIGFKKVDFDADKCADMSGMRVVYVTPNHTPLDIRILSDLRSLQNAVDGLIEPIYSEPEGVVLVGNDESKLIGMKGNRRIGDGSSIIAGPFFVCGDSGEEFTSLTDEQAQAYMEKFAEPENISDEEVQADTGFTIHMF